MTSPFGSSQETMARLERHLTERAGWRLRAERQAAFVAALQERLEATRCTSLEDYYARLVTVADETETRALIESLTVGETYFRRVPAVFDCLRQRLIPELLHRKRARGDRRLSIWSAACASGEEPYSIAITLLLSHLTAADWDIEIQATDLSREGLERARRGRYRDWSFRAIEDDDAAFWQFFERDEADFVISPRVREMVAFEQHNLMDARFPRTRSGGPWDIILLRNVLIYFTPESVRTTLAKVAEGLGEDGALLIGECEILEPGVDSLVREQVAGVSVYRKATAERPGRRPTAPARAGARLLAWPRERPTLAAPRPQAGATRAPGRDPTAVQAPPPCVGAAHESARRCFQSGDHPTARSLVDAAVAEDAADVEALLLRATLSLLDGDAPAARGDCERVLAVDELVAPAHLLLGVASYEAGDVAGAHEHLRRALFLDDALPLGHFFMGRVRDLAGEGRAAIGSYELALKEARRSKSNDLGLGITPEALMAAVFTRIGANPSRRES